MKGSKGHRVEMRIGAAVFFFLLLLFLVLAATSTYSGIKARDADLIRIAYMNGYVHAIRLDANEMKRLQKDETLLKTAVEKAADEYMSMIHSLNK